MAGAGLYALARQQDAQAERVGLDLSRSVANAVDAELRLSIAMLEMLATAVVLDTGDIPAFRVRADRVMAFQGDWAGILLIDPSGNAVIDTRTAVGDDALPAVVDRESFERVLRTGTPAVGGLTRHPQGGWLFAVRVPVIRDGELRFVLTALVSPDAIREVLTRLHVPEDWVISVVDARGLRVARSRAHEENLGGQLSESAQQVMAGRGSEGFGVSYALEGERIFTPYSLVSDTNGWYVVLGIPTTIVDAAASRSLAVYGGGAVLSILMGTLGALWVARSIARPIADLGKAAQALGRREPTDIAETSIQEIREVGVALKAAAIDITRGETLREELLQKERHARENAEAADRAKEQFMAVLSHELRTPLNAVYGWARMLQSGQIRDEAAAARARDAIVRNADAQVQLIDDLLDFSRITSGKMRLDVRPLDLRHVLQEAIDAVRLGADAKGIVITTSFDPDGGPILGDPARLQQVAWNLLMNAVKFTPRGGRIDVRLSRQDGHMNLAISDTGEGIAPEVLPHVFERFRQADSSTTRTHGGLGLGLALARHLVELHGGIVVATSAGLGQGATFIVTLPIARSDHAVSSDGPAAPAGAAGPPPADVARLDGLRVLVADDDRESVALTEAILKSAGASVRTTGSARETLDMLRHWRPDVLVSDIEMPGEDGYALIQKVRVLSADDGGDTPAIALSAYGRPQDRLRALSAGFSMHVPKPVDPGELTSIIAGVAGQSERAS